MSQQRPTYTAEQEAAISMRNASVALSAGAGCGKTFVLTERFLSHLEPPKNPNESRTRLSQLVAITFTERAAREMRERIRSACHRRLMDCDEADVEHWRELLRELDSARISTIHSFCGSLLRSHAVEAGLDPHFRVLDQAQSSTLLFELIDNALRRRLADRDESVIELVVKFGLNQLREMVERLLGQRQDIDWAAWLEKEPAEIISIWKNFFDEHIFPDFLRDLVDSKDARTVLDIARQRPSDHPVMLQRFDTLIEMFSLLAEQTDVRSALSTLQQSAKVQGGGTKKNWSDESLFEQFRDAASSLRKTIDGGLKKSFDSEVALPAAEMGLRLLHLAEEVAREYEREKQNLGVLDFDDLLIQARRLLVGPDRKPLRRRWAEHLRLLLVDEFQDTDPLQVELVKSLCDNEVTRGKLFFVGDFKQSIYRFRGADPHVFRLLREEIPPQGRLPLSENFRSQPGIIQFVNTLFQPEFGSSYELLQAFRKQTGPMPSVEFLWAFEPEEENSESPTSDGSSLVENALPSSSEPSPVSDEANRSIPFSDDDTSGPTERSRRRESDWIARRIRAMLDSGETLVGDKESEKTDRPFARPVKQGDIAILFRALTDVAYYEEALRRYGIDYYLVGGHAFYAQQEVYDLLNLLRSLECPADEIALLGVLRSPFFSLMDETIYWLAKHSQGLHAGLYASHFPPELGEESALRASFAVKTLQELRSIKDRVPIAQLIRHALDLTGYDAILLTEFLGERKLANLHKLIEQARNFDESGLFSLADFITQLSEFVARQPKEPLAATQAETADVVRLMSIHQSKGLQFPVVFVADLDRPSRRQSPPAAFSPELGPLVKDSGVSCSGMTLFSQRESREELAEIVRLFYVATTRAADYLVLSAGRVDPEKLQGEWMRILDRHFDLMTGKSHRDDFSVKVVTVRPEFLSTPTDLTLHRSLKTIEEKTRHMAEREEGAWPPFLDSIPPQTLGRRPLSISRLSGTIHRTANSSVDPSLSALNEFLDMPVPVIDPRGLGTLVHAVLAEIDFRDPTQIGILLDRHAARHVGDDRGAIEQAREMLERFFHSDRAAEIASASVVHRELEFLLAWPPPSLDSKTGTSSAPSQNPFRKTSTVSSLFPEESNLPSTPKHYFQGVIDCLYQDSSGLWHLLDFKTNVVSPVTISEVSANYEMQMLLYAYAVEVIGMAPPSELVLHFLRSGSDSHFLWNEEARQRILRLVDQGVRSMQHTE